MLDLFKDKEIARVCASMACLQVSDILCSDTVEIVCLTENLINMFYSITFDCYKIEPFKCQC